MEKINEVKADSLKPLINLINLQLKLVKPKRISQDKWAVSIINEETLLHILQN